MPDARMLAYKPKIFLEVNPPQLQQAGIQGILSVFPRAEIHTDGGFGTAEGDAGISIEVKTDGAGLNITGRILRQGDLIELSDCDREIGQGNYAPWQWEQRRQERVKGMVQQLLTAGFGVEEPPWGILVGVRPTKMVHRYLDQGLSEARIEELLRDVYRMRFDKIELLMQVVHSQRRFFTPESRRRVSIYVGIPFCPTRCHYCSFAAYPLGTHGHLVEGFFAALLQEVESLGHWLTSLGIQADTWYIGGGTPTILTADQLELLLERMRSCLPHPQFREFTVEAGRADTITAGKLQVMRKYAVNRLSINPQSMQQRTLDAVGRRHTVEQVISAFALARDAGFETINADLILGLPGEKPEDVTDTLAKIRELNPENLTVHTLAVKRAATWRHQAEELAYPTPEEMEIMAELTKEYALAQGLLPYYLYRQRYTVGDLENIGYAKPGTESGYNVFMMEERQSIIALGGGGITKFVYPDETVVRVINPKCSATYAQNLGKLLEEKKAALTKWCKEGLNC